MKHTLFYSLRELNMYSSIRFSAFFDRYINNAQWDQLRPMRIDAIQLV